MSARLQPSRPDRVMSLVEAAEELGVHYMTAYRYVRLGKLAATRAGGQWQVTGAALAALRSPHEPAPVPARGDAGPSGNPRRTAALATRMMAGDHIGAWQLLESALASGAAPADLYTSLLGPALESVGDRWAAGTVSIAEEHEASVVAMRLVGRLGALVTRRGRSRGAIVLAAAPGDRHGLPSAMLADQLRHEGFRVADLGADTPAEDLASAAAAQDGLVAVGICATNPLAHRTVREIRRAVELVHQRTGRPVLLGGRAVTPRHAEAIRADHHTTSAGDAVSWFGSLTGPGDRAPRSSKETS